MRDSEQVAWLFTEWCGLLSVPTERSGRIVCRPSPSDNVRPLLQCVVLFRARTGMFHPRLDGLFPALVSSHPLPVEAPQLVLPLMLPMMRTSFALLVGVSLKFSLLPGPQASLKLCSPINLVFSWSAVPTLWKRSVIVPVFKREDPCQVTNCWFIFWLRVVKVFVPAHTLLLKPYLLKLFLASRDWQDLVFLFFKARSCVSSDGCGRSTGEVISDARYLPAGEWAAGS